MEKLSRTAHLYNKADRFKKVNSNVTILDPRTVLMAIPCHDGRNMAELTGFIANSAGLYAALSTPTECSHVSLVRNLIAGSFLASPFEWFVGIDNDIVPRRSDLELLLQPCDPDMDYAEDLEAALDGDPRFSKGNVPPRPSRITLPQCTPGRPLDEKTVAAADRLVVAEYAYKNDTLEPVKFGMGFVRIHRSVFEQLQELKHDGGPTVEVQRHCMQQLKEVYERNQDCPEDRAAELTASIERLLQTAEDKAGQPRLWQVSHKGRIYTDFFPSGPILSQFVPTAEWKGEDHGFFTLCHLAGIIPRVETRTRLLHLGRKGYPYIGPDAGGGQ
jgi:hypothetical protein